MIKKIKGIFGKNDQFSIQEVSEKENQNQSPTKNKTEAEPAKKDKPAEQKKEDNNKKDNKPENRSADGEQSKQHAPRKKNRSTRRKKPQPKGGVQAERPPKKIDYGPWDPSEFRVEEKEGELRFHDLDLPEPIMRAIYDLGFKYCTPIQAGILPKAFTGADVTGKAQTGTGKSAAFLLTILRHFQKNPDTVERKAGRPRALILAPTRELVIQIEKDARDLAKHMKCSIVGVYGGMDFEKQRKKLAGKDIDIIAATPGRLIDFMNRKNIDLSDIEILVLDEGDRMLDMGFLPDIRKIMNKVPPKENRQTMLFSATLSPQVTELASRWTKEPFKTEIEPDQVTADTINQYAYMITDEEKYKVLYNLLTSKEMKRVIIFCNRKDVTKNLSDNMQHAGINCSILTGDISQKKRIRTLEDFKAGKTSAMFCTDVAARGIHIPGVTHVINYNLPDDPEVYVHRIGRTGRAGAKGESIILACEENTYFLPAIEKFIGDKVRCVVPEEELLEDAPEPKYKPLKIRPQKGGRGGGGGRGRSGGGGRGRQGGGNKGRSGGGRPPKRSSKGGNNQRPRRDSNRPPKKK